MITIYRLHTESHWTGLRLFKGIERWGGMKGENRGNAGQYHKIVYHSTMIKPKFTAKTTIRYTFVLGLDSQGPFVSHGHQKLVFYKAHHCFHPSLPSPGSPSAPNLPRIKATLSFCYLVSYSKPLRALDKMTTFWAPLSRATVWVRKTQTRL